MQPSNIDSRVARRRQPRVACVSVRDPHTAIPAAYTASAFSLCGQDKHVTNRGSSIGKRAPADALGARVLGHRLSGQFWSMVKVRLRLFDDWGRRYRWRPSGQEVDERFDSCETFARSSPWPKSCTSVEPLTGCG